MSQTSLSYLKTTVPAAIAGVIVIELTLIAVSHQAGIARALVGSVGWFLGLACECVALGGLVVLYRSRILEAGEPDLFLRCNAVRDLEAVSSGQLGWGIGFRRLVRLASGASCLLVGDLVQVRSLQEIETTLDESGCLAGLPFMAEMAAFCGQKFRVYRNVDKVYDYGRSKALRRLNDVVLLAALRCDGRAHGGCQAGCSLLWKRAWLRTVAEGPAENAGPRDDHRGEPVLKAQQAAADQAEPPTYVCQYSQLSVASSPMSRWDVRQDLRPLFTGNVTVAAFCVALLTRLFNAVQGLRGGSGYPTISRGTLKKTPLVAYGLVRPDPVRVLRSEEIATTLDARSRNRGLWFDREMIKHCGRSYRVLMRVEQIIDNITGRMLRLKTPCIVLDRVDSSGEFLRFCPQHEYLFWREVWLSPKSPSARLPTSAADTLPAAEERHGLLEGADLGSVPRDAGPRNRAL